MKNTKTIDFSYLSGPVTGRRRTFLVSADLSSSGVSTFVGYFEGCDYERVIRKEEGGRWKIGLLQGRDRHYIRIESFNP